MFILQAIHELFRGEQDLIEDLQLARKVWILPLNSDREVKRLVFKIPNGVSCIQAYHDPMLKLSIMTQEELAHIFGDLDAYIPLHECKLQLISIFFKVLLVSRSSS